MLVDNDTRIKYKDGFISRVYYQDNIVYEGYVNITVNVTIDDQKGGVGLYDSNMGYAIARVYFAPYRKQLGPQHFEWVDTFNDTYKFKIGAVISFKATVSDGYESVYYGFDPKGTVVNEDRTFTILIRRKGGGDIM